MSNSSTCEAPSLSTEICLTWEESLRDTLSTLWGKKSIEIARILWISTIALRKDFDKLGMDGYKEHGSRSEILIELTSRWVDFFVKKYGNPISHWDTLITWLNSVELKREVIPFSVFQKKYFLTLFEWTNIKRNNESFFKKLIPNTPSSNYGLLKEKEDEFLFILSKNRGVSEIKKV